MNQKKLVSIILASVLALALTGVSFAGTLSEIVKRGELRVRCSPEPPPMPFLIKTGNRPVP